MPLKTCITLSVAIRLSTFSWFRSGGNGRIMTSGMERVHW